MRLAATYICVKDMDASIAFYKDVLQMEPTYQHQDRWVEFCCGDTIALYHRAYDEQLLLSEDGEQHFNEAYRKSFYEQKDNLINTCVIYNFVCEDLKKEHHRLSMKGYAVSDIMYVNIAAPYWYFTIIDPDGNELEITGKYVDVVQ